VELQHKACLSLLLLAGFHVPAAGLPPNPKPVFISYREAQPILQALADKLPPNLKDVPSPKLARGWPGWVARHDAKIRARLFQGEQDSLVNLLLLGTSFTRQPRASAEELKRLAATERPGPGNEGPAAAELFGDVIRTRIADLARAMAAPGEEERLLFARNLLEREGYGVATPAGRAEVRRWLLANLRRVLEEQATYEKILEAARLGGNATEEFITRSSLYQSRGLSLDTSLFPDLALEQALRALRDHGLLKPGEVRRVAVIGPGLDFTDKAAGYDFYPLQTIQPFAVMDSLLRLGLAQPGTLEVTTLDISAQVNEHLARARERARRGLGYVVQLPLDPRVHWDRAVLAYWEHFGSEVGEPVSPVSVPPSLGALQLRAVRIRPEIVDRVAPVDLDIVVERLEEQAGEKFDLMIATNVLVYYGVFEQCLAEANVQRMLRPGGFLLSNNALLELPSLRLRSAGYTTAVYSDRPADGDRVVWYQRTPD